MAVHRSSAWSGTAVNDTVFYYGTAAGTVYPATADLGGVRSDNTVADLWLSSAVSTCDSTAEYSRISGYYALAYRGTAVIAAVYPATYEPV